MTEPDERGDIVLQAGLSGEGASLTLSAEGGFILLSGTAGGGPPYTGSGSQQAFGPDFEIGATAGTSDPGDTAFLAAIMGNLISAVPLTKTHNYLGGVIGFITVPSTASTYPVGAVLAGVADGDNDVDINGVVAFIDGDSAITIGGAAFKVMNNNSNVASGFHFGLDLQAPAHDGYQPVDSAFYLEAPLRLVDDVVFLVGAGVPTNAVTGAGVAGPGSLYFCTGAGTVYRNTNTKASPTWVTP